VPQYDEVKRMKKINTKVQGAANPMLMEERRDPTSVFSKRQMSISSIHRTHHGREDGIFLREDVLRKIYRENALKLMPHLY